MSTKTLIKGIAKIAILAISVGGLSVIAAPSANAAAASFTVDSTSVTVIENTAFNTNNRKESGAAFLVSVKDNSTTPVAANLANGETITATVIGFPAQSAFSGSTIPSSADLEFTNVTSRTLLTPDSGTGGTITYLTNNCNPAVLDSTNYTGRYCFAVNPTVDISDWGTYTIAIDLKDVNNNILQRTTVKYAFVSSAASSGAVVTIAQAGSIVSGETYAQTATKYMSATITDANGGRLILNETGSATGPNPALSATLETSTGTSLNTLTATDDGVDADDAWTNTDADGAVANDGVYGLIPSAAISSSISTTAASTIRVRFGLVNVTKAVSALPTGGSFPSLSTRTVSVAGGYTTSESTTANGAVTWEVPLTTTSATVSWTLRNGSGTVLTNEPITVTTTWAGNNPGSVSPVSGTTGAVVLRSDAAGKVTHTVTQTNPLNGSSAQIAVTGQASGAGAFGTVTLEWGVPVVTSLTTSPDAAFKALAATSNSVTVTAKDQFGMPLSGVVIQPGISGATSANYTTTAKATLTTGTDGTATYTVTGGAAATTDTFTFSAAAGTVTATSVTATYVAALPVIATLTGTYASDQTQASTTATVTSGVYAGLFSTTPISATAPIAVDIAKDYSVTHTVSSSTSDTGYKMRILAKDSAGAVVRGMPITVTAGEGGHFTDSCSGASGVLVTTKTCYTNSAGYIHISTIATGAGNISYTFTAGTVSASQSVATKIADNSARFVTLTGDATGTTNKRASLVATVTDRFGNAVPDVNVQMSTTGVGSLGGGAKIGTFTTGTDGKISFTVESDEAGTTSVTARLSTAYDSESLAGYQSANYIGTLFSAAGVRSGSTSVVWTLVKAADTTAAEAATAAAEAAADAAAEAIDAANAATDAANLAAEAADAATVAAEEARDAADAATAAVEELASQVATLMAALKAQITTLANTVAKIAKKVKA